MTTELRTIIKLPSKNSSDGEMVVIAPEGMASNEALTLANAIARQCNLENQDGRADVNGMILDNLVSAGFAVEGRGLEVHMGDPWDGNYDLTAEEARALERLEAQEAEPCPELGDSQAARRRRP